MPPPPLIDLPVMLNLYPNWFEKDLLFWLKTDSFFFLITGLCDVFMSLIRSVLSLALTLGYAGAVPG